MLAAAPKNLFPLSLYTSSRQEALSLVATDFATGIGVILYQYPWWRRGQIEKKIPSLPLFLLCLVIGLLLMERERERERWAAPKRERGEENEIWPISRSKKGLWYAQGVPIRTAAPLISGKNAVKLG